MLRFLDAAREILRKAGPGMEVRVPPPTENRGAAQALRQVAAHLAQGRRDVNVELGCPIPIRLCSDSLRSFSLDARLAASLACSSAPEGMEGGRTSVCTYL